MRHTRRNLREEDYTSRRRYLQEGSGYKEIDKAFKKLNLAYVNLEQVIQEIEYLDISPENWKRVEESLRSATYKNSDIYNDVSDKRRDNLRG